MDIIKLWLINLFGEKITPTSLVDVSFAVEDGMTLENYWNYELDSSSKYSDIFNITKEISYKILYRKKLANGNFFNFIYVYNSALELVFKMNITTSSCGCFISSNNYMSQIVPKYEILNGVPQKIKIAIKSPLEIIDVVSANISKTLFTKGANFSEDGFYNAEFDYDPKIQGEAINFFIKYRNLIEKRIVYFDKIDNFIRPYDNKDNCLKIIDNNYPVNLAVFNKDGTIKNYVYPRNTSINTFEIDKAVVTDVLDNDWVIDFN